LLQATPATPQHYFKFRNLKLNCLPVYLCSVYLTTLSINWSRMVGQLMNWTEFGRKR